MYNGKMHKFGYKKTHFLIHTIICVRDNDSWSLYHRKWKLQHPLTFRKIQNEISNLSSKFSTFSIFGWKYCSKCSIFPPKNENIKNFVLKLEISFWIFQKVKRDVMTFISCDMVIRNHDLVHRSSYVSENAFSCIQIYAFFPLPVYIFCEI